MYVFGLVVLCALSNQNEETSFFSQSDTIQNQNQACIEHATFPALVTSYMFLCRLLIGLLHVLQPQWLAVWLYVHVPPGRECLRPLDSRKLVKFFFLDLCLTALHLFKKPKFQTSATASQAFVYCYQVYKQLSEFSVIYFIILASRWLVSQNNIVLAFSLTFCINFPGWTWI